MISGTDYDNWTDPECFNVPIALQYNWIRQQTALFPPSQDGAFALRATSKRRPSNKIDRIYPCTECDKSYGSISHLNTHRKRKQHGVPLNKGFFQKVKQ